MDHFVISRKKINMINKLRVMSLYSMNKFHFTAL